MRSARAERDVVVRVPGDVEAVGIVERALVAVGRRVHEHHPLAGGDLPAVDLGVGGRPARELHDGADPAQQLLDRGRHQCRVGAQPFELLGVFEQHDGAGGDQVAGRLAPRVLQEHEEEVDLQLRERLALDLGGEQHAEQVVARLRPPLLAQPVGVHEHRGRGVGALLGRDRSRRTRTSARSSGTPARGRPRARRRGRR